MNSSLKFYNSSSFLNDSSYKLTEKELVAISVYISLVGGLGIIGNVLVIAAFYRYRSLRTSTNTFIVHLAFCNLILALLDITFSLPSSIRHKWVLGLIACRFYGLIYHFFCSVSLNTLAIISLDRYWVITKPSIGIKITIQRAVLCILVSYIYTIVFMVPVFLQWESFHEEAFYTGCYINYTDKSFKSLLNAVILGAFLFAVPFAVMIFCYGSIFTSVRRKGRYAIRMRPKCRTGKWKFAIQRIPHWRTARMIIVVIFVFLVCWSPYVIVSLCVAFGSSITVLTLEITLLLAKSGVIYNPFIYAALNLRFRTAFFEMLNCDRVANRTNWGVKSRVLSGFPVDSSGYLTSRASGCPSSKSLGASLLRTIERGSSVEAETPKPGSADQEHFLIEHGISFKRDDNRESSNSDELRDMEYAAQNFFKSKTYCSNCLKTCQKGAMHVLCGSCSVPHEKHCKFSNAKGTKSSLTDKRQGRQTNKEKDFQEKSTSGSNWPNSKRQTSLMEHRTGSLAEMNGNCINKERQYRRASLHTRHTFATNCVDIREEPTKSDIFCRCKCHLNEHNLRKKTPALVTFKVNSSSSSKQKSKQKTCTCDNDKTGQDNSTISRTPSLTRDGREQINDEVPDGNPMFLRRTSESIRVHVDVKKNTESFWRRPSLVVMNNIRPITIEHQNL